jgi:hypothetical protein
LNQLLSHMIYSFFNDKAPLVPKYSGVSSLEVLRPSIFLIRFFNQMLHPFIFLIRFSDWISLFFSVYKLAFEILINTYEFDFVASTSFTIYWWLSGNSRTSASIFIFKKTLTTLLIRHIQTFLVLFRTL